MTVFERPQMSSAVESNNSVTLATPSTLRFQTGQVNPSGRTVSRDTNFDEDSRPIQDSRRLHEDLRELGTERFVVVTYDIA